MKSIFRTKTIQSLVEDAKTKSLDKSLSLFDLILIGIGGTIGTGIFVLTGIAAANHAGPAISISYLLAGFVCIFVALAYSELAALVPIAGSAYTYSYTILGEFIAWLVACGLITEYTFGASTVAAGWSGYFVGILNSGGIHLPDFLTKAPADGGLINLPAVSISLFIGTLLISGTKESMVINRILVAVKILIIFFFLLIAVPKIEVRNYVDFMPFGWHGVITGAATIFLAYAGFDAISAAAEESKNPNRDLPIAITVSVLICALLYVAVSLSLSGIVNYKALNNPEPIAYALRQNGSNIGSALVGTGAIVGMISVLLVLMYGQSRILFVISRDGLLPGFFSKLHKKFHTPYISCFIVTVVIALISGFLPIKTIGHLTSFGTLFAFLVVSVGVLVLRIKNPNLERPFKCPAVFLTAPMAILSCGYLIYTLLTQIGLVFLTWIVVSLAIYFLYSYKKSPLN